MQASRLTILTSRYFAAEATPEEERELDRLLASDPDAAARFKVMQQYWEQEQYVSEPDKSAGFQALLTRLELPVEMTLPNKRHLFFASRWMKYAAAMLLMVGLALAFYMLYPRADRTVASLTEKHNSKGIKSTIELADGSKVWLNADSKISYPETFSGNTREIYLQGEAFFEVTRNVSKPFIIHLQGGTVRVLGTSFNIRAYENERVVETSVNTGKVAFIPEYSRPGKKKDTIFLLPDHKVKFYLAKEEIQTTPTIAREDKSWIEGKLVFKSKSMGEIAIELERNFGKKVVFADEEARDFVLTGSFQNNSLDEIMYYLSKTKNFYYKITNAELVIALSSGSLQAY